MPTAFIRSIFEGEELLLAPRLDMQVICLEQEAFYSLIDEVVCRLEAKHANVNLNKWLSDQEAMDYLNIKSKTTLQKLRDEGRIRFSQPQKKIILYDRDSIEKYLDKHARNVF